MQNGLLEEEEMQWMFQMMRRSTISCAEVSRQPENRISIFQFNTLVVALGPLNRLFRNIKSLFLSTPGFLRHIDAQRLHKIMRFASTGTYCITYQPLMNPPGLVLSWIDEENMARHIPIVRSASIDKTVWVLDPAQTKLEPSLYSRSGPFPRLSSLVNDYKASGLLRRPLRSTELHSSQTWECFRWWREDVNSRADAAEELKNGSIGCFFVWPERKEQESQKPFGEKKKKPKDSPGRTIAWISFVVGQDGERGATAAGLPLDDPAHAASPPPAGQMPPKAPMDHAPSPPRILRAASRIICLRTVVHARIIEHDVPEGTGRFLLRPPRVPQAAAYRVPPQQSLPEVVSAASYLEFAYGDYQKRDGLVLWVDPDYQATRKIEDDIIKMNNRVKIVRVPGNEELFEWLEEHQSEIQGLLRNDKLRVVSNRWRRRDGGEQAGRRLVEWTRETACWRHIKILIFCADTHDVVELHDPYQGVFVTTDENGCILFGSLADLDSDIAHVSLNPWRTVLWVDPKYELNAHVMDRVQHACPAIRFKLFRSTSELEAWLDAHEDVVQTLGKTHIRVVTNRARENDGGEGAWELALNAVRKRSTFIRVMVFCGETKKVALDTQGDSRVEKTRDISALMVFALFEHIQAAAQNYSQYLL
eukprot:TRINITY_DN24044_c0_g1_i1.p1 TRINITY_DN24044_c0_g1~~TRINITY_DN24044_c0_g1_i1.p1  ORF type:complete len:669 (+),score=54.34 TRINITY_DN24044_c0_g1_i1:71-2008(+)